MLHLQIDQQRMLIFGHCWGGRLSIIDLLVSYVKLVCVLYSFEGICLVLPIEFANNACCFDLFCS
jgi:hypothetical protein